MNFLDTNILLDYPLIIKEKEDCVIVEPVLKELDYLKDSPNYEKAKKARKAQKVLNENIDSWKYSTDYYKTEADDVLLDAVTKTDTLITNDIILQIRAKKKGVPVESFQKKIKTYSGITYLSSPDDDLFISEMFSPNFSFPYENHYFVIKGSSEQDSSLFKWEKGKLVRVSYGKSLYNSFSDKKITPRNIEQIILTDILYNTNITIVLVNGQYGAGKSLFTTLYALEQLEKGKISKIVYVPNNSQTKDTIEMGTLPGEEYAKILPYLGTLCDILGEFEVQNLYESGRLELMPISLARGRNIENSIIIVNEAQNLTEYHIKLLLGRVGEGSRIFFDGDLKQTDKRVFEEQNGLKLLTRLSESDEYKSLFAHVNLIKSERSKTAMAAQFLDEIE